MILVVANRTLPLRLSTLDDAVLEQVPLHVVVGVVVLLELLHPTLVDAVQQHRSSSQRNHDAQEHVQVELNASRHRLISYYSDRIH